MKTYLLLISLVLFSCGSRKVESSISEHEKKNDITTDSKIDLSYKFDKMTLEPFDPLRPILIGGKEYYNTKIVHHYEEGEKTEEIKEVDKSEIKEVEKEKTTERDNTKLFAIIGLGLIAAMFFFFLIVIFGMVWFFNKKISSVISLIPKNNVL